MKTLRTRRRMAAGGRGLGGQAAGFGAAPAAGNFCPAPNPAPEGKNLGACQYCTYALLCGFTPAAAPEAEEGEAD